MTVSAIFAKARELHASDVHVAVGYPLFLRVDGVLLQEGETPFSSDDIFALVKEFLSEENFARYRSELELDASHQSPDGTRFRINCHFERSNPGFVARVIPTDIPSLESIGLADIAQNLCALKDGLVLFTGPTGTGKSTSLASMIQYINEDRGGNIITFEDPIEFLFPPGKGIIRQREFGEDFHSFGEALRHVLRQDPDVVLVGEMRDLDTMATTLTLAETGHLVFATLHTPNTLHAVNRIIDVFPAHQQTQVRAQLSFSLRAAIGQRLLPKEGGGRIAQREILINSSAVSNLIREGRTQELASIIQTGAQDGMRTFQQDAKMLLDEGSISQDVYDWTTSGHS